MRAGPGAARPTVPLGWRLIERDAVASTNDEAALLLAQGQGGPGTIVWARSQRAGRGRHGRSWQSLEGNLYCSAILSCAAAPPRAGELTFVVALALVEAIEALAPDLRPRLKWPNDVMIGGAKVSGILLESAPLTGHAAPLVIAGVGVNVAAFPEGLPYPTGSLHAAGATDITPAGLLTAYAAALRSWHGTWCASGFDIVRASWLARGPEPGQRLTVRRAMETVEGFFVTLGKDGALCIDDPNGQGHQITAGDVIPAVQENG